MKANPEIVEKIALAAVALHNYLRQSENTRYTPSSFIDSENSSGEIVPVQWRNLVDANSLQNVNLSEFEVYKYNP